MLKGTKYFAGASLPLKTGVENMMRFTGCTLREAIDMATKNPAALYGLDDRGGIAVGKRADLITFEMESEKLNISGVISGGEIFTGE